MLKPLHADDTKEAGVVAAEFASRGGPMIRLTRINKTSLAINADLIKFVESAPDTVITLSTGEKVVVTESLEQIIALIVRFRRLILAGIPCPGAELNLVSSSSSRNINQQLAGVCDTAGEL